MNKRRRSIRFKHGLMTASALSRAEGLTDDALLAILRKEEAAQKAAAATREGRRRPRPSVEPTVWRPSAEPKSDSKSEHRRAAFLATSGRSRETASWMPGATARRRCGQSAPIVMQAPQPGVPVTGTVPDRSSRFSGLAPRPIGHLTRRVSPCVPDESSRSRSLRGVDCVDSGETSVRRRYKGSTP
jgi:hypothetical protein